MSGKLELLLRLKKREVDNAAKQLAEVKNGRNALQQQLRELASLRNSVVVPVGSGISAEEVRRQRAFADKLNEAQRLSETQLQRLELALSEAQRIWRLRFEERRALQDVVDQRQADTTQQQSRRLNRL